MAIDPGDLADLLALRQRQATNEKIAALEAAEKRRKQEEEILASRKEILYNVVKGIDECSRILSVNPTEAIIFIREIEKNMTEYSLNSSSFDNFEFKIMADKAWNMLEETKSKIKTKYASAMLVVDTATIKATEEATIEVQNKYKENERVILNSSIKLFQSGLASLIISSTVLALISDKYFLLSLLSFMAFAYGYMSPFFVAISRSGKHSGLLGICNVFFGWTVVGWIGVMYWAFRMSSRQEDGQEPGFLKKQQEIRNLASQYIQKYIPKINRSSNLITEESEQDQKIHISKDGNILGHRTRRQITALLVDGRLSMDDLFFDDEAGEWKKIRELKNLEFI